MATLKRFRFWSFPAFAPRAAPERAEAARRFPRRKKSRRAVLLGFFFFVVAVLAFDVTQDEIAPHIRDPEYARRTARWHARIAEHPTRPVVLAFGSSRVAMAVRASAWEEVRPAGDSAPLLLNMSAAGHGPVGQLLFFRRVLAEGPKPDAILIEYWPPFLRADYLYSDEFRTDWLRLGPGDYEFVREYFFNWQNILKTARNARLNPFYVYRYKLLNQINPRWLPWGHRQEILWEKTDDWGWLPAIPDDPPGAEKRPLRMAKCYDGYYRKLFDEFSISPLPDRAFREIIALAKEHGIRVGLMYLPESADFRAWYPTRMKLESDDYLARLVRETNVPLIDARAWMPNDATCDGFHMHKAPAAEFSRRLGAEVMSIFPGLSRRPNE